MVVPTLNLRLKLPEQFCVVNASNSNIVETKVPKVTLLNLHIQVLVCMLTRPTHTQKETSLSPFVFFSLVNSVLRSLGFLALE